MNEEPPGPYRASRTLAALERLFHRGDPEPPADLRVQPPESTPWPAPRTLPEPGMLDRLAERLRKRRPGRPRGRVVTLGQIEDAYQELSAASEKRPSQADVARRLGEDVRNIERALGDEPGFWDRLQGR